MADSTAPFRTTVRGPLPADDETDLPAAGDGTYQPYARPANKPLYAIHFINTKGIINSFQYVHLDSNSQLTPECITLRFIGFEPVNVKIVGRNLGKLYDYLHQHRMAWVAEAGEDFTADGQPVVLTVKFEKLESER